MQYWLMKSEPKVYSIYDLEREKIAFWEGVRNYQARNFIRDDMKIGDLALYYHSNDNPSGVSGVIKITRAAYPDHTAFEKSSKYYDTKSNIEKPRWFMVDVQHLVTFKKIISLAEIKQNTLLKGIMVAQKGNRLSVQPLSENHFKEILKMAEINLSV